MAEEKSVWEDDESDTEDSPHGLAGLAGKLHIRSISAGTHGARGSEGKVAVEEGSKRRHGPRRSASDVVKGLFGRKG
jgi:hypothetical protein